MAHAQLRNEDLHASSYLSAISFAHGQISLKKYSPIAAQNDGNSSRHSGFADKGCVISSGESLIAEHSASLLQDLLDF